MSVYDIITGKIIEILQRGVIPWKAGWSQRLASNLVTQNPYRGINALLLNTVMMDHKYPWFLTFKQAKAYGGYVIKGSHGYPVCFYMKGGSSSEDDDVNEKEESKRFLMYSTVFNLDQCEGIELKSIKGMKEYSSNEFNNEEAERIISCWRKVVNMKEGNKASYLPSKDLITMPDKKIWTERCYYYSTFFHEIVHSTGHPDRLNRFMLNEVFDKQDYSKEELIAELGSAFLNHDVGIGSLVVENNASYISSWIKALNNEKMMIVRASSAAQKAVDYIKEYTRSV